MFQFELDNALLNVSNKLNSQIVELISQKKRSISVAESITSGLIFNSILGMDRSKKYCVGGVVCQHVRSYITLAGVCPTTYKDAGLKGSLVAVEMAQGVKEKSQSDIGLGVYGMVMNVGGKESEGCIYMALVDDKKTAQHHVVLEGSESAIKTQTITESLVFFRDSLNSF